MSSRAKLLAELEEKSQVDNRPQAPVHEPQSLVAPIDEGYDPYDNPGIHKTMPDDPTLTKRRRVKRRRGFRR